MLRFNRFLMAYSIMMFSSLSFAVVDEQPSNGMASKLNKLKDQCQNVSNKLQCYEFGIDLLLGLTTEKMNPPEETEPVIQNIEVFDEESSRFKFSGNINGFPFEYRFSSLTDLRFSCFSEDIGVPAEIDSFQIDLFIDGEKTNDLSQSSGIKDKYSLCSKFFDIASSRGAIPINHLPGTVITGNLYNDGFWFPFVVQYENLDQFERECVDQYNGSKFYNTNAFYLAIHTEIEDSEWRRYYSTNGNSWTTVASLCSAVRNTVRKLIPTELH